MTALALAFSAGMVATLNPCGFAMLPAYLSYFMGLRDEAITRGAAMRSALIVGSLVSAGFLGVFGVAGIVIAVLSRSLVTRWIPWLALGVGVGVLALGVALLLGYRVAIGVPGVGGGKRLRRRRGVFGFGVSYAIASLSCTLPVFLTVVAAQMTQRSIVGGVLVFVAYALGMATVLLGITVILAAGKRSLVGRLRSAGRHVGRASGAILALAGIWIVWFWSTALTGGSGALGTSATFRLIEQLSSAALDLVADNTLVVALASLGLVGAALVIASRERREAAGGREGGDAEHGRVGATRSD